MGSILSLGSMLKTVDFADKNDSYQQNAHSDNFRDHTDRSKKKCQKNSHYENGRAGRLGRENPQKNEENSEKGREFK